MNSYFDRELKVYYATQGKSKVSTNKKETKNIFVLTTYFRNTKSHLLQVILSLKIKILNYWSLLL